jgi:hypothetical protein
MTRLREVIWLSDISRGYSIKDIARREGLGCRRIQLGVARAREQAKSLHIRALQVSNKLSYRHGNAAAGRVAQGDRRRPPRLVPLFPIGALTPQSACPHRGPIPVGSVICCMVCYQSGVDDHPALKRDPRTDPRPDSRPADSVNQTKIRETRKQRRQRQRRTSVPD